MTGLFPAGSEDREEGGEQRRAEKRRGEENRGEGRRCTAQGRLRVTLFCLHQGTRQKPWQPSMNHLFPI